MKTLSIKNTLAIGVVAVGGCVLSMVGVSAHKLRQIEDASAAQSAMTQTLSAVKQGSIEILQIQQLLTDVGATGDPDGFEEARKAQARALEALGKLDRIEKYKPAAQDLAAKTGRMHIVGVEMARAYIESGQAAGNAIMKRETTGFDDMATAAVEAVDKLVAEFEAATTDSAKQCATPSAFQPPWACSCWRWLAA